MLQKKLIESIGNLSDSYIEEALNMQTSQDQPAKSSWWLISSGWRPKLASAAAILCVGIGLLYVIHSALPNSPLSPDKSKNSTKTESDSKIFTPLRVVAYAAETTDGSADTGTELQADVPTILSKYSSLMSSVPAMPFSFSYDEKTDGETIRFVISADNMGIMQKYEVGESWKLTEEASTLECQEDEKVYWMPTGDFQNKTPKERDEDGDKKTDGNDDTDTSSEKTKESNDTDVSSEKTEENEDSDASSDIESINAEDLGADSNITVQVYSGQTLLETRYIGISYDDIYYTATLKLNVTSESEDFGDYTIESKFYEYQDEETEKNIRKKLIDKANRDAVKDGETARGGAQAGVPSSEKDEYDIEIQSIPRGDENDVEIQSIPKEELMEQNPSRREYGYPTKEYFIEKEYHKK